MPGARWIAVAVLSGGIALGAILGLAANPVMKMAPEQHRQGALQLPAVADPGFVEAGVTDVSPYPDSYAPSWANEEFADWEPRYPAWTYSDFASDSAGEQTQVPAAEPQVADDDPTPPPSAAPARTGEPETLAPEPRLAGNLAALY